MYHKSAPPVWTPLSLNALFAELDKRAARRTAASDFGRAGVNEGVIMQLCGWRTRSMFGRYNIIDVADLPASVAKRFGSGRHSANIEGPSQDAD